MRSLLITLLAVAPAVASAQVTLELAPTSTVDIAMDVASVGTFDFPGIPVTGSAEFEILPDASAPTSLRMTSGGFEVSQTEFALGAANATFLVPMGVSLDAVSDFTLSGTAPTFDVTGDIFLVADSGVAAFTLLGTPLGEINFGASPETFTPELVDAGTLSEVTLSGNTLSQVDLRFTDTVVFSQVIGTLNVDFRIQSLNTLTFVPEPAAGAGVAGLLALAIARHRRRA